MSQWDAGKENIAVAKVFQAASFNGTFSVAPLVMTTAAGTVALKASGSKNVTTTGFDIYSEVADYCNWVARSTGWDDGAAGFGLIHNPYSLRNYFLVR